MKPGAIVAALTVTRKLAEPVKSPSFTFTVTRMGSSHGAVSANYAVRGSGTNPAASNTHTSTGNFHLNLGVKKSANLFNWSPLTGFTPTYDPLNGLIDLEITPDGSAAQFFQIFGDEP